MISKNTGRGVGQRAVTPRRNAMHGLKAKATNRSVSANATPWRYGTIKLLEIGLGSDLLFLLLLLQKARFRRIMLTAVACSHT